MSKCRIPLSPLTTRLSGSARETECRIRNIFQWKKKRPPVLVLVLAAGLIALCGSLVSCQQQTEPVVLVIDTQYYDTRNNVIEIPMLAAQGDLPQGAQSVNDTLSNLKDRYASILSSPLSQPEGNSLFFFPAVTKRYYNLVFYQGTADYGSDGTVFTLVYDQKADRLVTQDEALEMAGTTLDTLYAQAEDFLNGELAKDPDYAAQLAAQTPTLVGFRIQENGSVDFYLNCLANLKDPSTASLDPWDYLLVCSDNSFFCYNPFHDSPSLIPADQLQAFTPPLWYQWSENGGEPEGGYVTPDQPSFAPPQSNSSENPSAPAAEPSGLSSPQRTAFADALDTLLNQHTFPDGALYEPFEGDMSMDSFAVQDVDGDGQQELLLSCSNTYMAGMSTYVLAYDGESSSLRTQLLEFPALTFYNNGVIQADASHNQRMGGEFWPYSLYRYDAQADSYEMVAIVDAWDRSLGETNPFYDNVPYPADVDVSGTGFVYYIMPPRTLDYSHPVDQAEYQTWLDSQLDGAQKQNINWQNFTAANIQALRSGT